MMGNAPASRRMDALDRNTFLCSWPGSRKEDASRYFPVPRTLIHGNSGILFKVFFRKFLCKRRSVQPVLLLLLHTLAQPYKKKGKKPNPVVIRLLNFTTSSCQYSCAVALLFGFGWALCRIQRKAPTLARDCQDDVA